MSTGNGGKLIGYIRVGATTKAEAQRSIDAQAETIRAHTEQVGGTILATYVDIASGRNGDRPELAKAIPHAKRNKATIVVASLDRLASSVYIVSGLLESSVDFVCCDMPLADRFTLHIMAAVAEDQARLASEAKKAAKARGKRRRA